MDSFRHGDLKTKRRKFSECYIEALSLDLDLFITSGIVSSKLYDKRNDLSDWSINHCLNQNKTIDTILFLKHFLPKALRVHFKYKVGLAYQSHFYMLKNCWKKASEYGHEIPRLDTAD